jgi:hypothetical protein
MRQEVISPVSLDLKRAGFCEWPTAPIERSNRISYRRCDVYFGTAHSDEVNRAIARFLANGG